MSDFLDDATAMPLARNIERVIVLNCFGRGGSSIVWNMIGSSPDVLIPTGEWHQGFYGQWTFLGRALRRVTRPACSNVPALGWISKIAHKRAVASVSPQEWQYKPGASAIVLKVMDHHIAMNPSIASGFREVGQVVLVRHPLAQCESLMRSGLSLNAAVNWYVDVMTRLAALAEEPGTITCRFDDLVRDPFAARDTLYRQLAIATPTSGGFNMKLKKFGEARTPDITKATGAYVDVTPQNVSELIDRDVNERSIKRLTEQERTFVWQNTSNAASRFGYINQHDDTGP